MFSVTVLLAAFAICNVHSQALLEPKLEQFQIFCDDTHLAVFFNKTALDARQDGVNNNRTWHMNFAGQRGDANCSTYHWDTSKENANYESLANPAATFPSSVHIGAPVKKCGINVFADATNIIYNTTVIVIYGENPTAAIGREEYNKYNIMCLRNRTVNVMENFNVTYVKTGKEAKNATEDFAFTFVHSNMADAPTSVYKLGEYIKFNLTSNTAQTEVKAVIQRCWTTTDGSANTYDLISNRCDMEPGTSWVSAPTDKKSVFKTEAFRYLASNHNKIYAQCLVKVCLDSQTGPDCDLCTFASRKRRNAEDEQSSDQAPTMLVKSPAFFIIKDSTTSDNDAQSAGASSNFLSGTNGLIVIILLATLVFVIAAAIIKKVFFNTPEAAVPFQGHIVSYDNKALA